MTTVQQLAFDLDELTRPEYAGPRVGFHVGPVTLAQIAQIEEEARRRYGNFALACDFPHIWFGGRSDSCPGTPGHFVEVASADLGCDHWRVSSNRGCSCIGKQVRRAFCECGWCSEVYIDPSDAVESWHDHAWPGWRGLPVVPESVRPAAGGINKKTKPALAWVLEHYPLDWQKPGAPMLTVRGDIGQRHVPGYSPWGGFDIAADGLNTIEAAS